MAFSLLKLRIALLIAVIAASLSISRLTLGKTLDTERHRGLHFSPDTPVVTSTLLVGEAREILQKVNLARREKGLSQLRWNEKLSELAFDYSKRMAKEDFFSHFDPKGKSIVDRIKAYKIKNWLKIGENLFMSKGNPDIAAAALKEWNLSETHRLNILDEDWTDTGIGVYTNKSRKTYITQVFMKK